VYQIIFHQESMARQKFDYFMIKLIFFKIHS